MSRVSRIFLLQTLYQEAFTDIPRITLTEPYAFVFPDEAAVFHGLNGSYVVRKAEVLRFPGKWIRRYFRYEFCLYINGPHSAGQWHRRDCCCI